MKSFLLSIANLFKSRSEKLRGRDDSTIVPAATTTEAVRNKNLHNSGRKEDVNKDGPSAIKTVTDQAIRETSRHEPLFTGKTKKLRKKTPKEDIRNHNSLDIKTVTDQAVRQTTWYKLFIEKTKKLFKKRPKEDIKKDNPSAIKTVTDQAIRQTTWHKLFIEKTKKLFKKRPKEDIKKDNPSAIKTVTHKPIRQTSWYDRLFGTPVEKKTFPKTVDKGRSFASHKSVFVSVNRGDSTNTPATLKLCAGQNIVKDSGVQEFKDLSIIQNEVGKNSKKVEQSPSQQTNNNHVFAGSPSSDISSDLDCEDSLRGDSTNTPATLKLCAGQNIVKDSGVQEFKDLSIIQNEVGKNLKKAEQSPSQQTNNHVFAGSPSSDISSDLDCEDSLSVFVSVNRGDSTNTPATLKLCAGQNIVKDSGIQEFKDLSIIQNEVGKNSKKAEQSPSQQTNNHVFAGSPSSDISSDLDCEDSLRGDSTNTPATLKLCAGQNIVKDSGVQEFKDLSIIQNEVGKNSKKAEQSPSQQTNNHVFSGSPSSDISSDLDCEDSLSVFVSVNRGDSTNTPATLKLCAGQNIVKDSGVQEFKDLSIIQNEVGKNSKKAEQSPSQQTNNNHVFSGSPSSDISSDLDCEESLGFPNPSQICYMNSILQSVLTLTEFTRDIRVLKDMWELDPEAEFLSAFMNIVRCHRSPNNGNKLKALFAFKMEVGKRYAEFLDMGQKDAHEFLTSFLDHIRSLCPVITGLPGMADIYVCPIQKHLMFKMKSTRACMKCGQRSMNEEVFNNLSLNLVPQESVKEMLDNYLLKTELECNCVCGGTNSTQCYSFDTLPRILILHVKRFCFTPLFTPKKLHDPINISRELTISSTQDQGWYSLVSVISHLGANANSGHYISAGVKRDAAEDDPTDQWVIYDDNTVTRTTGQSMCKHFKKNAYILFYKRHGLM
ncbi:uncharacterized protein [Paralichthys olivaceus]|uniref:uncharacterized protein isoform X3 n=1 Tax=Paralichthys olivaceus TaxID=8255 RepID=UPI003752E599